MLVFTPVIKLQTWKKKYKLRRKVNIKRIIIWIGNKHKVYLQLRRFFKIFFLNQRKKKYILYTLIFLSTRIALNSNIKFISRLKKKVKKLVKIRKKLIKKKNKIWGRAYFIAQFVSFSFWFLYLYLYIYLFLLLLSFLKVIIYIYFCVCKK